MTGRRFVEVLRLMSLPLPRRHRPLPDVAGGAADVGVLDRDEVVFLSESVLYLGCLEAAVLMGVALVASRVAWPVAGAVMLGTFALAGVAVAGGLLAWRSKRVPEHVTHPLRDVRLVRWFDTAPLVGLAVGVVLWVALIVW